MDLLFDMRVCVCLGGGRCTQACGGGNLRDKDHLEDLDIDGRIILKCIICK